LTDVDMYAIFIMGGGTFSATTGAVPGTLVDSQLFLFNSAGIGVYSNDDISDTVKLSTLPSGHPLTPTASGLYYLAVSSYDEDPVSAGGYIFPTFPYTDILGPTESGGGDPVTGWSFTGSFAGSYTLSLTGASVVSPIPVWEPGTLALLVGGLAGLRLL
jgi:hypothetical protein